jgi:hypothetical protein
MSFAQVAPQLSSPLHLGSHGEDVKELQKVLNDDAVGAMLAVDGRLGKATNKALIELQRRNGLKPDGVVGPVTARFLGWGYYSGQAAPYFVSFEQPPRSVMTPPLKLLMEAVLEGVKPVYKATRDAMFSTPMTDGNPRHNVTQIGFLDKAWGNLETALDELAETVPEGTMAVATLRKALGTYVEFSSDFANTLQWHAGGGYMWRLPDLIRKVPIDSIVATADRILRGDQTITMALAQLQIAFQILKLEVDRMPHTDANGREF